MSFVVSMVVFIWIFHLSLLGVHDPHIRRPLVGHQAARGLAYHKSNPIRDGLYADIALYSYLHAA